MDRPGGIGEGNDLVVGVASPATEPSPLYALSDINRVSVGLHCGAAMNRWIRRDWTHANLLAMGSAGR